MGIAEAIALIVDPISTIYQGLTKMDKKSEIGLGIASTVGGVIAIYYLLKKKTPLDDTTKTLDETLTSYFASIGIIKEANMAISYANITAQINIGNGYTITVDTNVIINDTGIGEPPAQNVVYHDMYQNYYAFYAPTLGWVKYNR